MVVRMVDTFISMPAHDNSDPEILGATISDQHRASNPHNSAWVSANAGSGKTFVLAQRVTRLLLNNVAPSKILCLTFTKAAAAEMSNRVFTQLSKWSGLNDDELVKQLRSCGENNPTPDMLKTARLLFTRALESPGGLKIQTIHAFCESLLHQFTLEANTSGHFEVMGDYQRITMLRDARQSVMAATIDDPALFQALATAMRYGSDYAIEMGLEAIIYDRQNFLNWINYHNIDTGSAITSLGIFLDVDPNETETDLTTRLLSQLPISDAKFIELGNVTRHMDFKECQRMTGLIDQYENAIRVEEKFRYRLKLYQTGKGQFRKKIPGVKALYDEIPAIGQLLEDEMAALGTSSNHYNNWKMLVGSSGLFKLADAVLQIYGQRKRAHGILDFDDLVNRAADLLARSNVRQWVQYKLDQGIDHVLVDEAQDTNPVQWQIIDAIIEEFFAGQSIPKPGRTVFAVGDQKQSIYSFQGAEPLMFARQKEQLNTKAANANLLFEDIRLPISFRSTRDVLSAVDKVFSNPSNARGLQQSDDQVIHEPVRQSDPGEVLIWPMIEHQRSDKQEDWLLPVDTIGQEHPTLQLSRRIAATIRGWIDAEKILPGKGRKITYGDVLILVRNRDRFAGSITRELKQADLSVAGADRLNLATHIGVEDLLSLGKWALFPDDDLSLAEILKSPLFDFDEEQLFAISIDRGERSLWQNLNEISREGRSSVLGSVVSELARLQMMAPITPPFEFYATILSAGSGRQKFRARLGSEVDDVLDAFLLEALNHTGNGGTGLQDFIDSLETAAPQIKREMDLQKDEIRVMTVHSAKGLEAPIVFLVDPGSGAYAARHRPSIAKINCDEPYPAFLWQPGKDDGSEQTKIFYDRFQQKAEEEYRRLLYVGMTRAEDQLVICGYANRNSGTGPTWHSMVSESLIEDCDEIIADGKLSAWRWIKPHQRRRERQMEQGKPTDMKQPVSLPAWLSKTSNREADVNPPLFPSLAGVDLETKPNQQDLATGATGPSGDNFAIQRGNAIHHLLQFLPSVQKIGRIERAANYLQKSFPDWNSAQHTQIANEVLAVLDDPQFAHLFSDQSRAEVDIAGIIEPEGLNRRINAKIDRIVIKGDLVEIIDYKSDRNIPTLATRISAQYLVQLAIYQVLLQQIFPQKTGKMLTSMDQRTANHAN